MIAIEDNTIKITRGDATSEDINNLTIRFPIGNNQYYEFEPSDKITFVVFDKKGYTKNEILKKEFTLSSVGYNENTTTVEINLTAQDTKKFPLKNKAMTYWYDIYLNDTQTILGFDDDGAKKLIVYPRGE